MDPLGGEPVHIPNGRAGHATSATRWGVPGAPAGHPGRYMASIGGDLVVAARDHEPPRPTRT